MKDLIDEATDRQWASATDMVLEDTDGFSAWLASECFRTMKDDGNVGRFARLFFSGRAIKEDDFPVKDLLWIVFCEEPELSRQALRLIREKYQGVRIDRVHENLVQMLTPDEDEK